MHFSYSSSDHIHNMYYHYHTNSTSPMHPQLLKINNAPDKVTKRYYHSISAVGVSDGCVWLMAVGGTIRSSAPDGSPKIALFELSE